MPEESRLEEQLVSQAVQANVSNQLESADALQVDVHTNLGKVVQGQVDSVSVQGQGMVIQDIRVEEMQLQTDRVSINPLSALFGKLKLNHPVNATADMVLTEDDVNRAVNSDLTTRRIPPMELVVNGKAVTVTLQHPLAVQLPGEGRIALHGDVQVSQVGTTEQLGFSVVLLPQTDDRPLLIEHFQCEPRTGVSIDFALALIQRFQELLSQPYIQLEEAALRIKKFRVEADRLIVQTEAHVYQIPEL